MINHMNNKTLTLIGAILFGVLVIGGAWYASTQTPGAPKAAQASQVVELKDGDTYTLTASYVTKELGGKVQTMLAYNGTIPGPTIKVEQGAGVTINFKNDTDMPALLHSHGVRMDNAFDGSQLQQKEIAPGGSFSYKLTFPDAGVYWYHPHANEVYGQALGLYGAFVVAPNDTSYFPPVNREEVLFLSDLQVATNGDIAIAKAGNDFSLMGHFGNVQLVNGEKEYSLSAKTGEVVRLYVINAANTRPFNFALESAKLKLVGADNGAYERATWQDSVTLAPSERAIVDVMFTKSGTYAIQNKTPNITYRLGSVTVADGVVTPSYAKEFNTLQTNESVSADIAQFLPYAAKPADKKLVLTVDLMGGMSSMSGMGGHMMPDGTMMGGTMGSDSPDGIEWEDTNGMMNSMSTTDTVAWHIVDATTGKRDMDIDWTFKKDQPVKIEIYNDPNSPHPMQHPIHFHGQRFLVVSRDGVPQTNLVWKDTVLVKAGERIEILLDPSNPGTWMAHCHIAEHLAAGMMFSFKVE